MVAVINGLGLGLYNNNALNPAGGQNNPTIGRFGDRVYVNGQTGNLVIQRQDEFMASVGLDLGLLRTYNSQGTWDGDNNDNWLGGRSRLYTLTGTVNTSGSTITKTYVDGYEAVFTYQTSGVYAGKYVCTDGPGAHDTLSHSSNTWTWTDGTSAVSEVYETDPITSGSWRLKECTDADGNTTAYGYDATSGMLTTITDESGQTTTLTYNGGNQLTGIATTSNSVTLTRVSYTYASNRLATVTVDLTPANTGDAVTFVTTYGYDGSGRVNSIAYTDGTEIGFEYDGSGRVITITDGNDQDTTLVYNTNQTDITDALGRVTRYRFDSGKLVETLSPQLLSGERLSTQYEYDADNNIVRVIDAKGNAVDYVYADGKLMEERDAAGNTIHYTYTASNQISTRTVYRTPDPDGAGEEEPQQPLTTHYIYDSEDHLLFSVSPEGSVTEYRYNTNGSLQSRLTFTANAYTGSTFTEAALDTWVATADLTKVHRTDYTYDFRGQLQTQTTYGETNTSGAGVSSTASTTEYVYDRAGRLLSTVDANDNQTVFQYDGLGRLTSTTDALDHITTTTYLCHCQPHFDFS
jgi:YD repeat-containing protein